MQRRAKFGRSKKEISQCYGNGQEEIRRQEGKREERSPKKRETEERKKIPRETKHVKKCSEDSTRAFHVLLSGCSLVISGPVRRGAEEKAAPGWEISLFTSKECSSPSETDVKLERGKGEERSDVFSESLR